ncbi:MAG TPA: hypothetical protein VNT31_09985 [Nocardioides sp.]|nr:hypothetical protein [Nocardioides sp.]
MTRTLLLLLLPVPFAVGLLSPGAAVEPVPADPVLAFTDPAIVESSGLVVRDGLVVTVNDSGDGNRLFTVDPATGDTVGVTRWQGDAQDIEALAPAGDGAVWVGDIGDNAGSRESVEVAEVPFGRGDREVEATTFELTWPDGARDAETLLAHPVTGRLYVVSKEFIGRLWAAPARLDPDGPNELRLVDEVLGIATDGAFLPDGRHVVVRNYGQAAVYTWPALGRVGLLELPVQEQGEGIAVAEDGTVLVSSEGQGAEVLRIELPADVRAVVAGDGPTDAPADPATPDGGSTEPAPAAPVQTVERSLWPWAIGGIAGVVMVVVLVRSLRPG